ncbi:carbamoyltransferase family protein [Actinomadura rudentiformis]|uniref:Carbamoyltransferase n=1 Tax=Actinomadura rudentiformis TaxID=359158 RepID=A0A6H9Z5W7_9ACTN|nr:carbamoyltransferase C-terminal domain-containing protein [Actinomadura rudentiformis]KAB2352718.1 carbamoyltransferase [Actinomadura rudentiformis]
MRILGINSIFHDPAAALVVDGRVVAATDEERFSRRKHGKRPVPFSAWELPEMAARWCLEHAGLEAGDIDAIAYSYDPGLAARGTPGHDRHWEQLRTLYAQRAPYFLATALPGIDAGSFRYVPHHIAHAASAALAAPGPGDGDVLVLDGRGEAHSHLSGTYRDGVLTRLSAQALPHSLGLMYEELTQHLGFLRSSDEYKVMALASYGEPRFLDEMRKRVRATADGGFAVDPIDWGALAKARRPDGGITEGDTVITKGDTEMTDDHADLAASVQARLEEVILDLAAWLQGRTGSRRLSMAGGVALNCVANSRLAEAGIYDEIWVQPAAGDAGTALGAALHLAQEAGEPIEAMPGAALGRGWDDWELAARLDAARIPYERPDDLAAAVADALARNEIVAWFQGRSEWGPRALGHRSLLAHPGHPGNLERLNAVKGREQFRPIAPMVALDHAAEIFEGPLPSPYMLFVHRVKAEWRDRIAAVVHVDGTARIQTVSPADDPLVADLLEAFRVRTGLPVVVNTSLNTAGRPMVDDPRDALECFGSAPVDLLAIGPYVVRRREVFAG